MTGKDENVTSDELLKDIVGEPQVEGFRKGMNKKKILKSLTKDDWIFIDKAKEADERKTNDYSYHFFVKSDQMYLSCQASKRKCADLALQIRVLDYEIKNSEIDIEKGETSQKNNTTGELVSLEDLALANEKKRLMQQQAAQNLIVELGGLFTFVGRQGLDRKVFFTEEEYNGIVEDILLQIRGTGISIYEEDRKV